MTTRKKPWNRPSLAVYSASSLGQLPNMHICTYVSAVSMQPKRMMVALYHGTLTLENVVQDGRLVLQLLADHQYNLVNLLGKQSGRTIPKIQRLQKRNLLDNWQGYPVLKDALSVMLLQVVSSMDAGDHTMFLCDVLDWKNQHDGNVLTTTYLNEKNIIRA